MYIYKLSSFVNLSAVGVIFYLIFAFEILANFLINKIYKYELGRVSSNIYWRGM